MTCGNVDFYRVELSVSIKGEGLNMINSILIDDNSVKIGQFRGIAYRNPGRESP